jgi:integrase
VSIDVWAAECEAIYGLNTVKKSLSRVKLLFRELRAMGITSCDQVTPVAIAEWFAPKKTRLAHDTQKTHLSTMRTLCTYGKERGFLSCNPFATNLVPKASGKRSKKKKRHHSYVDVVRVIEHLRENASISWKTHRLYAYAATMAMTGLRKTEGLKLKISNLDLDAQTIEVEWTDEERTKTEESQRTIGMPDALREILDNWLTVSGHPEWVFPNCLGTGHWHEGSAHNKPLNQLKAAAIEVGVEGFTLLSLRHTWATHAQLLWQLAPATIAKNLGHTTIKTSYAHYTEDDLASLKEAVKIISFVKRQA